jgi:hypothetical protein
MLCAALLSAALAQAARAASWVSLFSGGNQKMQAQLKVAEL